MGLEQITTLDENNPQSYEKPLSFAEKIKKNLKNKTEQIATAIKYGSLKDKEVRGVISKDELDSLLAIEFDQFVADNPPLEEARMHFKMGDNPYEKGYYSTKQALAELKTLPKSERKEALEVFKQKRNTQEEALAECRTFIERIIKVNNNVPKDELMKWVGYFNNFYAFDPYQLFMIEEVIDKFYRSRFYALSLRREFPNDRELAERLTGVKLKGWAPVKITVGPMNLNIYTNNITTNRYYYRDREYRSRSMQMSAFASKSEGERPTYYSVINIQSGNKPRDDNIHELEHHTQSLIWETMESETDGAYEFTEIDPNDRNLDPKKLARFMRFEQRRALKRAAGEMLSIKRQGAEIDEKDFAPSQNGGWDFLRNTRNLGSDNPIWKEYSDKILVEEYSNTIINGINAFKRLETEGGYSTDEVIALLTNESLTRWPRIARRFLEN